MIASIGPFWDANETWLVLGVGVLLIAFPQAHGQILGALYLPVTAMLIGLILAWRRRSHRFWDALATPKFLLVLFALVYTGIHVLTWTLIRYRLPVDAVLLVFAGVAFDWIATFLFSRGKQPG